MISGAGGRAFCAGADISQFEKNRSTQEAVSEYDEAVELASRAYRLLISQLLLKLKVCALVEASVLPYVDLNC